MPNFENRIYAKSCDTMNEVPDGTVDCIVTSPPYEMQRRYGEDPQDHGLYRGSAFISRLEPALREAHRVLRPDGNAFFNFLHSSVGGVTSPTLHMFPAALEQAGFKIVQPLYWLKVNARPTADPRLMKSAVELVYHTVKTLDYYADKDAVRVQSVWAARDRRVHKYNPLGGDRGNWFCPALDQIYKLSLQDVLQAVLGDGVDALPLRKSQEQLSIHPAKMPDELAEWLIRYGSRPDALVCDPWTGSGTTLCRAKALGRRWVGYELSTAYAAQAEARVEAVRVGEAVGESPAPGLALQSGTGETLVGPTPPAEGSCRQCGARFRPKRQWQAFCSSRCRYTHHNRDNTRLER